MINETMLRSESQKYIGQWEAVKQDLLLTHHAMPLLEPYSPELRDSSLLYILQQAEQGSAEYQKMLGSIYMLGRPGEEYNVEPNPCNALYWLSLAAAQNDGSAQFELGMAYADGKGLPQDPQKALVCFYQSALNGYANGQMMVANHYMQDKAADPVHELYHYWMEKAAWLGKAEAQYRTGTDYLCGIGCNRDPQAGMEWMEKAAAQGQPDAMLGIGIQCAEGTGRPQDLDRAKELLQGAARQNHLEAKFELGKFLCTHGSPQEQEEGNHLIEQAAEEGFPAAMYMVAMAYLRESATAAVGFAMLEQAAQKGYALAQARLADLYCYGDFGAPIDYDKALYWNERAARQGEDQAQNNLALMYIDGMGVEKDPDKAFFWAKLAAQGGKPNALLNLAHMYKNGEGTPVDLLEAFRLYMASAQMGESTAQFYVGKFYNEGLGVERDQLQAVEWFTRCADQGDADAMYHLGKIYMHTNPDAAADWLIQSAMHGREDANELLAEVLKDKK